MASNSTLRILALGACSLLVVFFVLGRWILDTPSQETVFVGEGAVLVPDAAASVRSMEQEAVTGAAGMLPPDPPGAVKVKVVRGKLPMRFGEGGEGDVIPLNLTWNALREVSVDEQKVYLEMIRSGDYALEPSGDRLHGIVGLADDLELFWTPGPAPPDELIMVQELRRGGGFNLRLSDATPLDRSIYDSRQRECKRLEYNIDSLPQAAVVIVFYNEPFSTLMRSVHSVLNLTPPKLLKEIILVDDGSNLDWIKKDGNGMLEKYISLLPKTRLVRLPVRRGIVAARMAGIRDATAPIFVILDSHIEVEPVWLEPIVQRIAEDRTRVVMPQVDAMDPETLGYRNSGIGCTLGFLWKLIEHGYEPSISPLPERRKAGPADFVTSPTMAGGLFAANQNFFLEDLGGYDEQFQYWGTENLELSFRLWQCGGVLECAPCSRVYHIFRKGGAGYSSPEDSVTRNKLRLLAIWMDQYADLAWRVIGKPNIDFGDYDELLNWKKEKQCKGFQWYLDNVNPESFVKKLPEDVPRLGPIVNAESGGCLDIGRTDHPEDAKTILHTCHGGQTQDFMYFRNTKHIMPVQNDECCIKHSGDPGSTAWCNAGYNEWLLVPSNEHLLIKSVQSGKCLSQSKGALIFANCDRADQAQLWDWSPYNPPKVWTPPPRRAGQ